MKLLHIADLHIGKRVNEFNMIPEQEFILHQIVKIGKTEEIDGVLIAGDVYDKSLPSAEAVEVLDDFLTELTYLNIPVFIISGNHDSPERIGFASRMLKKNHIHIAGVFDGDVKKISLKDEYGEIHMYLLPFLKPAMAKPYFDVEVASYEDAVQLVLENTEVDITQRNILIAHQFVISGMQQPQQSDSENISVGGLDYVDASIFHLFDYVALGHLHRPQRIGRDTIRYAGSPLKYSFSEAKHQKSATIVEMGKKGDVAIRTIPLIPLHDMREIKGPIQQLLQVGREDAVGSKDYIHATLTDDEEIYDPIGQMRQVYPNLMLLDFENTRTKQGVSRDTPFTEDAAQKNPLALFLAFYQMQNNNELRPEEIGIMKDIFQQAGGDEA